ncbi:MAG TPA: carboxypeptidase-like regulatory domain-containing protein [bacterium]|nr:carboxypeptidase-like regulatory domain-containing protein [bacterium]HQQ00359.1 carboxypeptidase-like regulatory domain-containing protein [bacterium]
MRFSFWLPILVVLAALAMVALLLFLPPPTEMPEQTGMATPVLEPTRVEITQTAEIPQGLGGNPLESGLDIAASTVQETTPQSDLTGSVEGSSIASGTDTVSSAQPTARETSDTAHPPTGDTVSGAVYSGKRLPLAGVAVVAGEWNTTSDSAGRFTLSGLREPKVDIVFSLAGHQTVTKNAVPVGTKSLSVILVEDGHLAGRVTDQNGKPVSYASVRLEAQTGVWILSLETDISGSFDTENVPNAQIHITATCEGLTDTGGGSAVIDAPYPELVMLRLQRPSLSISGSVVMADTGQGVAEFALIAQKQDESTAEPLRTTTSSGGSFRFDELDIGVYLISADAGENQDLGVAIPATEDHKTVRVFDKNVENVVFLAGPGLIVSGRVIGPDGNGVPGAMVTLADQPGGSSSGVGAQGRLDTNTVSDGGYELRAVPSSGGAGGMQARMFASHSQYGSGLSEPFSLDPNTRVIENINITLTGSATVTGHVLIGQQVASGARVTLIDLFQNTSSEQATDQMGGFAFEKVSVVSQRYSAVNGSHTLVVEMDGYATKRQDILVDSTNIEPIIVILDEGGFIQGRALDSQGRGVPGVSVNAISVDGQRYSGSTNDAGVYYISGLKSGTYDLLFRLESKPPMYGALYDVPTGQTAADVVLQKQAWTVMGTVADRDTGKPISRYVLAVEGQLKDPNAGTYVTEQNLNTPDGTYQLTFHEAGVYYIHFSSENYQPWDGAVAMTPETQEIQFVNAVLEPLQATGRIVGSIEMPQGTTFVLIEVLGHGQYSPSAPNEFVLEEIPAGKHSLIFYVRDPREAGARVYGVLSSIRVIPGQTTNLGFLTASAFHVSVR